MTTVAESTTILPNAGPTDSLVGMQQYLLEHPYNEGAAFCVLEKPPRPFG